MNEQYDVIVLGTGLKECMIAGLLAKLGNSKNFIFRWKKSSSTR